MKQIIEVNFCENNKNIKVDIRVDFNDLLLIVDWYEVKNPDKLASNDEIFKSEIFKFSSKSELEIETDKYLKKLDLEHNLDSQSKVDKSEFIIRDLPNQ